MKRVLGVLLVLCLLATTSLLLPACQEGEEEEEEEEGQLPTIQVGDRWVWSYRVDGTTATLSEEVTGEETVEGRVCYVMDMLFDPLMSSTHEGVVYTTTGMKYWGDKATGLLGVKMEWTTADNGQVTTSSMTYSYSPWASLFPLEVGREVETEKTTTQYSEGEPYGDPVVSTEKYTVVSKEDVNVTAGTFSCWKITYYDSALDTTQTMWWSDEAKTMVKSTDEDGKTIMELQSYSVR